MTETLVSVHEAAQRLAISTATVRRWVAQQRIPSVRLGRVVRIRESDIVALIRWGYKPDRASEA